MLAWLQACINWLCKQWAWAFARRIRLNNSSVDVGPVLAEGGFATVYEAIDVRTKTIDSHKTNTLPRRRPRGARRRGN